MMIEEVMIQQRVHPPIPDRDIENLSKCFRLPSFTSFLLSLLEFLSSWNFFLLSILPSFPPSFLLPMGMRRSCCSSLISFLLIPNKFCLIPNKCFLCLSRRGEFPNAPENRTATQRRKKKKKKTKKNNKTNTRQTSTKTTKLRSRGVFHRTQGITRSHATLALPDCRATAGQSMSALCLSSGRCHADPTKGDTQEGSKGEIVGPLSWGHP